MYSSLKRFFGYVLLALQVIMDYVLLGVLVTRCTMLFAAGRPAGTFEDDKEKKEKNRQKDKSEDARPNAG